MVGDKLATGVAESRQVRVEGRDVPELGAIERVDSGYKLGSCAVGGDAGVVENGVLPEVLFRISMHL